jgi:hypothetical protein
VHANDPVDRPADVVIAVAEIGDDRSIDSEIVGRPGAGQRAIRLNGVPGHRRLAAGLARSSRPARRSALLMIAGLLSSGCSEELGPVPMPVTRVRGIVREGDRPVPGGWIEFIPVERTVGNLRSARLLPDGSFDAEGVAVGKNAIRLVNVALESPRFVQLFCPFTSPIRRVITEPPTAPLDINLVQEAVRYEQSRRQALSREPPDTGESP